MVELGFGQPDVIAVQDEKNHYLLRLEQISSLSPASIEKAKHAPVERSGRGQAARDEAVARRRQALDPPDRGRRPAGDRRTRSSAAGLKAHDVVVFGNAQDFRYEAQLVGIGDKLVHGLQEKLGDKAPEKPLRVEWVGPKAGQQLRDAALKSILYAIAFIMLYVAFRFDLRFAPGGVVALLHDALITLGIYVVLQKEMTLGTIAAVLTVIGYSINDTIVVYDRIRENMQRMRTANLAHLINVSTSQTLGRTVITSGVAMISVLGFFIWGTPLIRDIVFALSVGFLVGTYSSIYVAAPFTEWMDRRVFRKG